MRANDWPQSEKMKQTNLGEWIGQAISTIKGKTEFPFVEINAIASSILGKSKEWVISHPETSLTQAQITELDHAVERLLSGEPLAYITRQRAFYGLDFEVNRNVLIPRPETEILVEEVIHWLEDHPNRRSMADIGTGSGIIAVTCADRFPDLRVTAIDISPDALVIARKNADRHDVADRIEFVQNDLLTGVKKKFDIIAANLPYIPTDTLEQLDVIKFEPRLALDGGKNGTILINRLLEQSTENIRPGGCLFLEIQYNQDNMSSIIEGYYPHAVINILNDLASLPRVIKIQL